MPHPYKARPKAATHVWLTPPEIIKALGVFSLDPCAQPEHERPWPTALYHYALPEQNGLTLPWFNRVWLNPPYGKHAALWLKKMAEHGCGTALVFARTETQMFMRYVWPRASALLFLAYRPHFHYPDGTRAKGNSGGPMVLIAYGKDDETQLGACKLPGAFIKLR